MLMNRLWDTASGRRDLFEHPAFAGEIVITRRIQWIPGPRRAAPRQNHAWLLWDWQHAGPPTLSWAPAPPLVLSASGAPVAGGGESP